MRVRCAREVRLPAHFGEASLQAARRPRGEAGDADSSLARGGFRRGRSCIRGEALSRLTRQRGRQEIGLLADSILGMQCLPEGWAWVRRTGGPSYGGFFVVFLGGTRNFPPPCSPPGAFHLHINEKMSDLFSSVSQPPQRATEVLEGLQLHAPRADRALRPPELARRLGLGNRIVAVALAWLATEPASKVVRRQKKATETWDKFSFEP